MDSRPLYIEELLAVVGPEHRLFGRKWIYKEDILGEKFICNYSEADRFYLEDMLFQDDPGSLDIILDSNEVSTIRRMVESGAGITFMPARVVYQRGLPFPFVRRKISESKIFCRNSLSTPDPGFSAIGCGYKGEAKHET